MLHVCHYYAVFSVSFRLVVACGGKDDLLALLCVVFSFVFCHFPICVLIRKKLGIRLVAKNLFKPSSIFLLTYPRRCFFVDHFVTNV